MKKNAPLFVYDCDGTLELPIFFAYAYEKQKNKDFDMTLSKFKETHPNEKKLMITGMSDLVRYTATLGNNVLLSGGNPEHESSNELKSLFPNFQNWQHNNQDVPFGREPNGLLKSDIEVAKSLIQYFKPSKIIVIGDSISEYELAKNLKADTLLMRGVSKDLLQDFKEIPHRHTAQTGNEMIHFIRRQRFSTYARNRLSPLSHHRRHKAVAKEK